MVTTSEGELPTGCMFRLSIRRKILGIAVGLIILMGVATLVSLSMVTHVGTRLEELTQSYVPAYGNLARAEIRSLERAVSVRRMVIERVQSPDDDARSAGIRAVFDAKGMEVEHEVQQAREALAKLIAKATDLHVATALARLDARVDSVMNDARRRLSEENRRLFKLLDENGDAKAIADEIDRVDILRDEVDQKLDGIRADMMTLLRAEAAATLRRQKEVTILAVVLTALATVLGLTFAFLVSGGMTRPVRRLLDGTRAVESGQLEERILVTTQDEIGALTAAFNRMVDQLKAKERLRETFGKYVDPRVVEGLIDRPALAAEGQRRVMTVLFCDFQGFTRASEGMTPQGLVKVMNRYLSTMSTPIRANGGVIDKYIGDAIMAYWGPPFTGEEEHAQLATATAFELLDRVQQFRAELPELLGLRSVPIGFDIRVGIATGEAVVGSIGSDLMMSYTVMGDTVNFASRLEGANRAYGSHVLVSEATAAGACDIAETREIDRVVLYGQSKPQPVHEIMARKGALTPAQAALREHYTQALAAYRARNWDEARRGFQAALDSVAGDGPSATMLSRIDAWLATPPGPDWDGAWRFERK